MFLPTQPAAAGALVSRLGLAALALLVSVPFLLPWHTSPIPSFYSEWWAVAFGLAASLALVSTQRLPAPGVTLLALALAALVWLQTMSGTAAVSQSASLYGLYLLWAALLASASHSLADRFGQTTLFRLLATALLIGAVLAALLSLLRPWLQPFGWPGFAIRYGGPIGQVNHFTSYLWLGLTSGLYLKASGQLPRFAFWTAAVLLTFTAVMVGQRSSLVYALALIGIVFWLTRKPGTVDASEPRRLALGIGLLFAAMQPVMMVMPAWDSAGNAPPPAMRAVQQAEGQSIRVQLLHVGLLGIAAAPLLGSGIGSYPELALAHADRIPSSENPGPAESAHNLLVDLAVDLGVPAALLVLFAALVWLWQMRQGGRSAEGGWAISVFAILGLHALIEYPLSHTYFLGLLAVVAGAFGRSIQIGQRLAPMALSLGLIVWGSLALAEVKRDYRLLEFALAAGNQPELLTQAQSALMRIPPNSLLTPWVATTACVSLDPIQVPVSDGLAVCRVAMRFAPSVESGVNAAVLQWRAGRNNEARDQLRRLRAATLYDQGGVDRRLDGLIVRDEMLAGLR